MNEGGKNLHEIEKNRKRAEVEKEDLQLALEEAETTIEQQESKYLRLQMEFNSLRQDFERKLHDKDEDFENTRRNHAKYIESIKTTLDAELRSKGELLKQKKKLENDFNDLEIAVDHANRTNNDLQKSVKRSEQLIEELQKQILIEQEQRDEAKENAASVERRFQLLNGQFEDMKLTIEQCESAKKQAESQFNELADRYSHVNGQIAGLTSEKRQLESTINAMQTDLDELLSELKNSEERTKKNCSTSFLNIRNLLTSVYLLDADTTRLADELRQEQEHSVQVERLRRSLEQQIKDLQTRLDEAEGNSLKGGKRHIGKLEERVRSCFSFSSS